MGANYKKWGNQQNAKRNNRQKRTSNEHLPRHMLLCRQSRIPILPNRFVAKAANEFGYFPWRTFIGDVKLASGIGDTMFHRRPLAGTGRQRDDAATFGAMNVLPAGASIATWFGVAPGAHDRDAKRN